MAKSFDTDLAALEALADADPATTLEPVAKALSHKNNFIVAKAAKLAFDHHHSSLIPELAAAFSRFLKDPVKTDPQCWAKNALVRSLSQFAYQETELFLIGMNHVQMEPVWGGTSDTAGTLRGNCAFGLAQCHTMSNTQLLTHLTPLFADKELSVRVTAARAVEQIGNDSSMLLLRFRAELASDDPELLGACYSGVLRLEGPSAIPWAAKFLRPLAPDDASSEAAFALADLRTEAAFHALHAAWLKARDPDFRGTLLSAIGLTRNEAAWNFLLEESADGSKGARESLLQSAPPEEILERLHALPL